MLGVDTVLLLASTGAEMARWCLTCACEAGDCLGGVGAAAGGVATVGAGGAMGFGGRGDTIGPTVGGPGQWPPTYTGQPGEYIPQYEYDPDYRESRVPPHEPRYSRSFPGHDVSRWRQDGYDYTRGSDGGFYRRPADPGPDALLRFSRTLQRATESVVGVDIIGTVPGGSKA